MVKKMGDSLRELVPMARGSQDAGSRNLVPISFTTIPVFGQLRNVVGHLAGLVLPATLEDLPDLAAEVLELWNDHLVLEHLAEEHDVLSDEPGN